MSNPHREDKIGYRIMLTRESLKEWNKLDHSIKVLFERKLKNIIHNPVIPKNKLHGNLSSCYKLKLNRIGYRLIYEVREKTVVLVVWAINKRDKSKAYKSASSRLRSITLEECTEIKL